jgi:SsrA-binding protein
MPNSDTSNSVLTTNRKARHDYHIIEAIEAGIELRGTEVKSAKAGEITLTGGYAHIENGQVVLLHVNIALYVAGNRFNHDPERPRRLLLHKREIRRLQERVEQEGHTLVPLKCYLKRGLIKIELGLCKGKLQRDKRETIRRRDADREMSRATAHGMRRSV